MDRHDVDVGSTQRFEHTLYLAFQHRKVTIHYCKLLASREGGPGIDPHFPADLVMAHLRGSSQHDLEDAVVQSARSAERVLDDFGIEGGLGRIDADRGWVRRGTSCVLKLV